MCQGDGCPDEIARYMLDQGRMDIMTMRTQTWRGVSAEEGSLEKAISQLRPQ